ncbi:MAG TPA: hypothetical protein VI299_08235 [Polyangiales bacterium]
MDKDTNLTDFKRELAALATLRDELKLKAHLARADLKSQFDDLERRWSLADEQLQRAKDHLKQDGAIVERKVANLLHDLKLGYQNVKRAFEAD